MLPTWYQFNFPKQVTLKGHRQENMSYNFSTEHFIVIFSPQESTKEGTFSYTVYSLVLSNYFKKKTNQTKNTEKEREKTKLCIGGKESQQKCYKKVNNARENSRIKGNISFLRFGMGNK